MLKTFKRSLPGLLVTLILVFTIGPLLHDPAAKFFFGLAAGSVCTQISIAISSSRESARDKARS